MRDEETFTDALLHSIFTKGGAWFSRLIRGIFYFIVAAILIRLNEYGMTTSIYLPLAIGILGAATSSARIGQLAITVLMLMAVLPPNVVEAIKVAVG